MTPQIKHSRFKTKIQLLFQITTYCLCICMQKTTSIFICKNKRKKETDGEMYPSACSLMVYGIRPGVNPRTPLMRPG